MTLYSLILTAHIVTALILIISVAYADHLGLLWIRGKVETLNAKKMLSLHHRMYVGLVIMLITGTYLFLPAREYLLSTPVFYIKMIFVGTLWVNSIFIGKLLHLSTTKPYALLHTKERVPLYVTGAISIASWAGSIIAATQLGL